MPALPVLSGRKAVRVFERFGWQIARQRGSHIILVKEGENVTLSVPDHANRWGWILPYTSFDNRYKPKNTKPVTRKTQFAIKKVNAGKSTQRGLRISPSIDPV